MSQVDNRNPSTAKRARTDGGRREDDWTCPGCGNVNFSFRTTCNMRNCTQPRPADHNVKSAGKPMHPPQPYSSVGPYGGGSGAPPSSMYLGMPPYGSSMYNGSSVPPYSVPYSGGAAYDYNYANRMSGGSPYRPLPMSGPPPAYSGGMYGMPPPMMDRYGMGMPHMAPPPMGPRPGFYPDDNSQKKDMPRENDWICPKCGNVNFAFRITCNMRKCGTPKPGLQVPKFDKNSKPKMPDGSWKCEECGNMNFPFRNKCNRQNCGAEKPSEENQPPSPEAQENEQVCDVICPLCLLYWLSMLSCFDICKFFPIVYILLMDWIFLGLNISIYEIFSIFLSINCGLFTLGGIISVFMSIFFYCVFSPYLFFCLCCFTSHGWFQMMIYVSQSHTF